MQSKSGAIVLQSGARLFGVVLQFFFLRACLEWLGKGYDGYLFAVSCAAFIGFADLGILVATQRFMGEAMAMGDLVRVATLYRFASRIYPILAGIALASFIGFAFAYDALWRTKSTDPHTLLLVLCGVQAATLVLINPATTIAYCLGRFREVAGIYAIQAALMPLIGFLVVWYYRTPESLAASTLAGACLTAFLAYRMCGAKSLPPPRKLDRQEVRNVLQMGARAYPNTITTIVGNNADRIQVERAGMSGSLVAYSVAGRVPEQIAQLLAPIGNTVYPELTRLAPTDEVAFARAMERNVRFTLVLAACIVLVPCAFSECILRTWLGTHSYSLLPAGVVLVMPLMALYRALELVYSVISAAFFAKGVPQLVLPFSIFNATVTVFATVPMYRWQGIAGVGLMNALIDVAQLVPTVLILKRFVTPQVSVREISSSFICILGLAIAITFGLHYGVDRLLSTWHPIVGFILAPACGLATIVLMTRLHLCAVPERVAARATHFRLGRWPIGAWLLGLPVVASLEQPE